MQVAEEEDEIHVDEENCLQESMRSCLYFLVLDKWAMKQESEKTRSEETTDGTWEIQKNTASKICLPD